LSALHYGNARRAFSAGGFYLISLPFLKWQVMGDAVESLSPAEWRGKEGVEQPGDGFRRQAFPKARPQSGVWLGRGVKKALDVDKGSMVI
jgi:hypothetical protein